MDGRKLEGGPKRYYRKRIKLFRLLAKMKLWPSRSGVLHGIKNIEILGEQARITTHCNQSFLAYNSRNSRAARALRNKWFIKACGRCAVPDWKLEKYSSSRFRRHYGSSLQNDESYLNAVAKQRGYQYADCHHRGKTSRP